MTERWRRVAALARWIGAMGLLLGWLALTLLPQRPDGDATALLLFERRHGSGLLQMVREAAWLNLAGALLAWGALEALLAAWRRREGALLLFWLGLLVAWGGWAWNQSRGWTGELFLEPGQPVAAGVDGKPTLRFERFLLPPAPDGPGRALALRLAVDGAPYDLSEARPYRGGGWTVRPLWYGATVTGDALAGPLLFGGDGTMAGRTVAGEPVLVTVDVETLALSSEPRLAGLSAHHHAILRARFAPGDPLLWGGAALMLPGAILAARRGRYNREGRAPPGAG